jgi:type II restriction enzyme
VRLALPHAGLERYKSASQRARVATESWGASNLFCAICSSPELQQTPPGTPAIDYLCPDCRATFQLKSQSQPFGRRIVDAAYAAMRRIIEEAKTPNLFILHYGMEQWSVRNLIVIPGFAFSHSAIERRKPLGVDARRAGWVGCNIVLANIPNDAKIPIITDGVPSSVKSVRRQYRKLRPLAKMSLSERGWTLDVLRIVRSMGKEEFELPEVYALARELARLHPDNHHVHDKIRQQLQVLRDRHFLDFLGSGRYRLR